MKSIIQQLFKTHRIPLFSDRHRQAMLYVQHERNQETDFSNIVFLTLQFEYNEFVRIDCFSKLPNNDSTDIKMS